MKGDRPLFRPATVRAVRGSAVVVALLAGLAHAQSVELLAPSGTVSPDGFFAGVRAREGGAAPVATLTADEAEVFAAPTEGPVRVFRVLPISGARAVTLHLKSGGVSVDRALQVGPPGQGVSLKLEPAAPVKNRDASAQLTIEMRNAKGEADPESAPPVLRANVGTIEGLTKVGPGVYRARYVLPTTRYPEVAVVVAFSAWPHPQSVHGSFGALRVPLASSVDLPGKTEGNAEMAIVIANQKFGPVHAGADGRFKLPVVVPPGYGTGVGTAVDRLGNRRVSNIDLMLPPTDQLACVVNPTQLPADGVSRARVLCATSDVYGNIATGAKVVLSARKGRLSAPHALDNGVTEWFYAAPAELSAPDALQASWKQGPASAREELEIALLQGPAASASVAESEKQLHLGAQNSFTVTVKDAQGRKRSQAQVALGGGEGSLVSRDEIAPGEMRLVWRAPSDGEPRVVPVELRAFGPVGTEPARIVSWAQSGQLFAAVTDLAGLPVPAQKLRWNGGEVVTDAEGVVALGPATDGDVTIRHVEWPGLQADVQVRDRGRVVFPSGARPAAPTIRVEQQLLPAVPINVRLVVKGREVTWWLETNDGKLVEGRAVDVSLSKGVASAAAVKDGRTRFTVGSIDGPATISIVDVETQVMALAEVRP